VNCPADGALIPFQTPRLCPGPPMPQQFHLSLATPLRTIRRNGLASQRRNTFELSSILGRGRTGRYRKILGPQTIRIRAHPQSRHKREMSGTNIFVSGYYRVSTLSNNDTNRKIECPGAPSSAKEAIRRRLQCSMSLELST
jgi:hypothetical protein